LSGGEAGRRAIFLPKIFQLYSPMGHPLTHTLSSTNLSRVFRCKYLMPSFASVSYTKFLHGTTFIDHSFPLRSYPPFRRLVPAGGESGGAALQLKERTDIRRGQTAAPEPGLPNRGAALTVLQVLGKSINCL
jgi:hypothetical protein